MAKPAKRKYNVERPYNGGEWSEARMISFIKSALRGARWPQKYRCIEKAFIGFGINPKTGRKCKLHLCPTCHGHFPQNMMQADHIIPVIGPEGFTSWDEYISRLFVEADGFVATCKICHQQKTNLEKAERKLHANLRLSLEVVSPGEQHAHRLDQQEFLSGDLVR